MKLIKRKWVHILKLRTSTPKIHQKRKLTESRLGTT